MYNNNKYQEQNDEIEKENKLLKDLENEVELIRRRRSLRNHNNYDLDKNAGTGEDENSHNFDDIKQKLKNFDYVKKNGIKSTADFRRISPPKDLSSTCYQLNTISENARNTLKQMNDDLKLLEKEIDELKKPKMYSRPAQDYGNYKIDDHPLTVEPPVDENGEKIKQQMRAKMAEAPKIEHFPRGKMNDGSEVEIKRPNRFYGGIDLDALAKELDDLETKQNRKLKPTESEPDRKAPNGVNGHHNGVTYDDLASNESSNLFSPKDPTTSELSDSEMNINGSTSTLNEAGSNAFEDQNQDKSLDTTLMLDGTVNFDSLQEHFESSHNLRTNSGTLKATDAEFSEEIVSPMMMNSQSSEIIDQNEAKVTLESSDELTKTASTIKPNVEEDHVRFADHIEYAIDEKSTIAENQQDGKEKVLGKIEIDLSGPSGLEHSKSDKKSGECYRCRFCGLTYNYMTTLKAHERVHDVEEPYVCTRCGLSYRYYSELQVHSQEHKGEKGYKCECGRVFSKYCDLLYHSHPGDEQINFDEKTPQVVEEILLSTKMPPFATKDYLSTRKAYYCQFCCKGYSTSHELKYHLYSHRGERQFNVGASRYLMKRI